MWSGVDKWSGRSRIITIQACCYKVLLVSKLPWGLSTQDANLCHRLKVFALSLLPTLLTNILINVLLSNNYNYKSVVTYQTKAFSNYFLTLRTLGSQQRQSIIAFQSNYLLINVVSVIILIIIQVRSKFSPTDSP